MENLFSRPPSKLRLTANQKIAAVVAVIALVWAVRQPWFPVQIGLKSDKITSPSPSEGSDPSLPAEASAKVGVNAGGSDPSKNSDLNSDFWEVSLDTDQTFYGRLDPKTADKGEYLKLTDVFYYQPGFTVKEGTIRLVKVGTELHQPQDLVYLNRSHIVAKQPLSSDSKVVKAIEDYQTKN